MLDRGMIGPPPQTVVDQKSPVQIGLNNHALSQFYVSSFPINFLWDLGKVLEVEGLFGKVEHCGNEETVFYIIHTCHFKF